MGRFRSLNSLGSIHKTIPEIYKFFTQLEPLLINNIRFRKLRAANEYLIFFDDKYYELIRTTMLTNGMSFIDECLKSFLISNVPLEAGADYITELLTPIIQDEIYVDFFQIKENARNKSARVHVPVNYWESDIGKNFQNDLKHETDGYRPYIKFECSSPFSNVLYLRLYLPLKKNKKDINVQKFTSPKPAQKDTTKIESKDQSSRAVKNKTEDKYKNDDAIIKLLIQQNEQLLQASKEQHDYIKNEFSNVNTQIKNLNVQLGQLFQQVHFLDQKLGKYLVESTQKKNCNIFKLQEKILHGQEILQKSNLEGKLEKVKVQKDLESQKLEVERIQENLSTLQKPNLKLENHSEEKLQTSYLNSSEKKLDITQNQVKKRNQNEQKINPMSIDLPDSPEADPLNLQTRKRNLTGTTSPPIQKKIILGPTVNDVMLKVETIMELKEKLKPIMPQTENLFQDLKNKLC